MENKELLIIIPACNEAENLPGVLDQLERSGALFLGDVLIINDASEDATPEIVNLRHYRMVTNVFRLGYGGAIQVGYKYAVRRGYQYVIQMDGDGQHDVCNIPVIYRKLKEADVDGRCPDIVLGARFMKESSDFPVSLPKRIVYTMFRFLIRMITGNQIADPTTGLQGLSRKAFLYYSKYDHFDDKYPDANMIILMILTKFRVVEIPAVMHARTEGKSMHSGLKPFWYMLRVMFSILIVVFRVKVLKMDAEVGLLSSDKI